METMMQPRLALQVQLMSEPCLWRWEIHDRERGEVLETSWTRELTNRPRKRSAPAGSA
jgi:hypothetical protein